MKTVLKRTMSVFLAFILVFGAAPAAAVIELSKLDFNVPDWVKSPLSLFASAADVITSGDWKYTLSGVSATVVGYTGTDTAMTIPSELDGYAVNAIGKEAFIGNIALKSVTIPDSVTTIGIGCFKDCINITTLSVGSGVKTWKTDDYMYSHGGAYANSSFENCTSLESVTFAAGVENVGPYAFFACTQLRSINVPKGIVYRNAFDGCTYLKDVTFGEITEIQFQAFYSCNAIETVTLPETLKIIGGEAFYNCTSLRAITIPDSVTTIGIGCFKDCTVMGSVVIGSGVTTWETAGYSYGHGGLQSNSAFEGCTILKSLTVKNGAKGIGPFAFYGCRLLEAADLPVSVEFVGAYAFYNCIKLATVAIRNGTIGDSAFENCSMIESPTLGTVTAIGKSAFKGCVRLRSVTLPDGLLSIDDEVFFNCTSLTSIIIPNTTKTIGIGSFKDCTNLKSAVIGSGVTTWKTAGYIYGHGGLQANSAFEGCTVLASVTVKEGVSAIGDFAFSNCDRLASISLPKSVEIVRNYAFSNCERLKSAYIANGAISDNAFENAEKLETVTLGTVTYIGACAFKNCPLLQSVVFPVGLTTINNEAFFGDTSITSVDFPDTLSTLGYGAFYGCTALKSVAIGSGLTTWNTAGYIYNHGGAQSNSAFERCTSLETLTVKSGTTAIGPYAFFECSKLKSVYLPNTVYSVDNFAFYNCYSLEKVSVNNGAIKVGAFENCAALTELSLVDVETVDINAFKNCKKLKNFTLPDGISYIGDEAFYGCLSLTKTVIPNTVKTIGFGAFYGCTNLEYLVIGSGVTTWRTGRYIYNYGGASVNSAFEKCTSLKEVIFVDGANCIGVNTFCDCTALETVCMPESTRTFGENIFFNCDTDKLVICVVDEETYAYEYAVANNLKWKLHNGNYASYITVLSKPTKTVYSVGEEFDSTGMKLSVEYNDGTKGEIDSGFNVVGFTSGLPGEKFVTVTYGNAFTLLEVTVSETPVDSYTVTYNANGGAVSPASVNVDKGNAVTLPRTTKNYTITYDANGGSVTPANKAVSCTFAGWYLSDDFSGDKYATSDNYSPTANATFYAKWTSPTAGTLPTPTRSGFTFDGWYTDATGGNEVTSTTAIDSSKTLYAHWTQETPDSYTVTYNANGGAVSPASVSVDKGNAVTLPGTSKNYTITYDANGGSVTPANKAVSCTFAGWYLSDTLTGTNYAAGDSYSPTANATFYAKWTSPTAGTLPTPTRSGFAFDGWYTDATGNIEVTSTTAIDSSKTLYAHWTQETPDSYTVTYNANGGAVNPASVNIGKGGLAIFPLPTKSYTVTYDANGGSVTPANKALSCTFAGWYLSDTLTGNNYDAGDSYSPTANATFYAKWTSPTAGTLPVPTRSGFTFDGWHTSADGGSEVTSTTAIDSSKTLYAHWTQETPDSYTVTYNANGGAVNPTSVNISKGGLAIFPKPTKSYTVTYDANGGSVTPANNALSCTFAGWYLNDTLTGTNYDAGESYAPTANATFYAKWTSPTAGTLPTPTRSGFKFDGWYTGATGGIEVTSITAIDSSKTLYAHWTQETPNSYTVTYNANGGAVNPTSVSVGKGGLAILPKPTKSYTVTYNANGGSVTPASKTLSCTFAGWYLSNTLTGVRYDAGDSYPPTANATFYAKWASITVGTLPIPTRSSFVFDGWYTSGGTRVTDATAIDSNITLYAHWVSQDARRIEFTGTWTTDVMFNYYDNDEKNYAALPTYETSAAHSGETIQLLSSNESVVSFKEVNDVTYLYFGADPTGTPSNIQSTYVEYTVTLTVRFKNYPDCYDTVQVSVRYEQKAAGINWNYGSNSFIIDYYEKDGYTRHYHDVKLRITPLYPSNQPFTVTSSNENVITYDETTGKLIPHKNGRALLTATLTSKGLKTGAITVYVVGAPETAVVMNFGVGGITYNGLEFIDDGEKISLVNTQWRGKFKFTPTFTMFACKSTSGTTYTYAPTNQGVTYKSADTNIATVDENGNVYGVRPGTVTITATSKENSAVSASYVVKIKLKWTQILPYIIWILFGGGGKGGFPSTPLSYLNKFTV